MDSETLQAGLEALQISPQELFERKIPNEADRQIIYTFYALSKRFSHEKALGKNTFEQIVSLARSFHLLRHRIDIRPYFAANVFSATSNQINGYCAHKTDADEATVDAFLTHPQFMYQRAPYTTPQREKLPITSCGKHPIVIASALWSINPHDERVLWYSSLTKKISEIKKLTQPIATLCGSEKDLFAATHSGVVIRPYCDNEKILCDEIVACDHPITHMAATTSGTYIIAGNTNFLSIIARSNGSYVMHKIDQLSLQKLGIQDKGTHYWAIAVGKPTDIDKKNLLTYWSITPSKEPRLVKKELSITQEAPQQYTIGKNNILHCALRTKSEEWALSSIRSNIIPGLALPLSGSGHIPKTPADEIAHIYTNPTGDLSIGWAERKETKKSWVIWDHTTDEIHELPDFSYETVLPVGVSADGDITLLAGSTNAGYTQITINARPHLSFINNPKSSFKSKLLLLAAVGAHCVEGILSIEDDPHWKEPFNEIPSDLQKALTELYPVYTKSLLGGPGKSIIK